MGRPDGGPGLVVGPEARPLKREIGALGWAVLEDVALDAELDGRGRLVAKTSTRRIAANLGMTPGAVARAVARLQNRRLLEREDRRQPGSGRFGETVYVLGRVAGLDVQARPCISGPSTVPAGGAAPITAAQRAPAPLPTRQLIAAQGDSAGTGTGRVAGEGNGSPASAARRRQAGSQSSLFDLADAPIPTAPAPTGPATEPIPSGPEPHPAETRPPSPLTTLDRTDALAPGVPAGPFSPSGNVGGHGSRC